VPAALHEAGGRDDIHHILSVFAALANPYILLGIASLLIFIRKRSMADAGLPPFLCFAEY
jgi:hypothetical protein